MKTKLFVITFLFVGISTTLNAQTDSVEARGFWQRYSKQVKMRPVDTTFLQKEAAREAKKVSLIYDVDFDSYFDNREYDKPYQMPQTLFNFRLSPTIGVRIRDNAWGKHDIVAGVRYTQPMGGDWRDVHFDPTAYYHYHHRGINLQLGAIPYENRVEVLPDWLMYDSITYLHPNIQGALISYQDQRGYVEFMCDWRGSQSMTRREMFRLIINGQYQYKALTVGGIAHLNHTAMTNNPATRDAEPLYDDLNLNFRLGADVTRYVPLDSLAIRAGYIVGLARNRMHNQSFIPQGMLIELYAQWWFVGLKNTFYYGDNLQPLRGQMGSTMCQGDPFYQSKIYNRTDIFIYLYRNHFVNSYFSWNMHYDGHQLQHQQQLVVRFSLNGLHKTEPLRGLFDK